MLSFVTELGGRVSSISSMWGLILSFAGVTWMMSKQKVNVQ